MISSFEGENHCACVIHLLLLLFIFNYMCHYCMFINIYFCGLISLDLIYLIEINIGHQSPRSKNLHGIKVWLVLGVKRFFLSLNFRESLCNRL